MMRNYLKIIFLLLSMFFLKGCDPETLKALDDLNNALYGNQKGSSYNYSAPKVTNQRCTRILISTNPIMYKDRCVNY